MGRKLLKKEVVNARLLKEYASWIYCGGCDKTVAYLCYTTYDSFDFHFDCHCGTSGSVHIEFGEVDDANGSGSPLVQVKNRLCCPADGSALLTVVDKNLKHHRYEMVCKACANKYEGGL